MQCPDALTPALESLDDAQIAAARAEAEAAVAAEEDGAAALAVYRARALPLEREAVWRARLADPRPGRWWT